MTTDLLISHSCNSCGASLPQTRPILKCGHCGTEHIIKNDSLISKSQEVKNIEVDKPENKKSISKKYSDLSYKDKMLLFFAMISVGVLAIMLIRKLSKR